MDAEQITNHMKSGHELRNFGNGWFLKGPARGRIRVEPVKVDDALVAKMEEAGTIKITLLTTSARADLV